MQKLFFRQALLPNGMAENVAICIENGLIATVEPGAAPEGELHGLGLPGMPNLHSHSFQRAIAGLTETRGDGADSFWTWRSLMYRFALLMSPDDLEAIATLAFIEMLESGFTSVAEFHYLHHAPDGAPYADIAEMATRLAAAAAAAGIELLLLPVFYAHSGFGGAAPAPGQRRFINSLDSYARLHERCRTLSATGIAPHSLRAATAPELAALVQLAGREPIHIHIAEQMAEVEDCLAFCGQRPVAHLASLVELNENWCLVHATHADAQERAAIHEAGAVIGLCPITEANLGDGIFPAHAYPGAWGIGSDSNVQIGVTAELRQLEYSQRLLIRQRNVMASATARDTATAMYQAALRGGAQAMGTEAALVPGAPANIAAWDADEPEFALAYSVFAAPRAPVRQVWVRGVPRLREGGHPLAEPARRRFAAVVRKLLHAPG